MPTTRPEWQPETWNRGEVNSDTVWSVASPSSALPASGSSIDAATVLKTVFCRLAIMFRWVDMIPLGFPVVPEE